MKKGMIRSKQFFLISFLFVVGIFFTSISSSQIKAKKDETKGVSNRNLSSYVTEEEWMPITKYEFSKVRVGLDQFLAFNFGGSKDVELGNLPYTTEQLNEDNLTPILTPTFYYLDGEKYISTIFDVGVPGDFDDGRPGSSSGLIIMDNEFTHEFGNLYGNYDPSIVFKNFKQYKKNGSNGSLSLKNVFELESSNDPSYHLKITQTMEYVSDDGRVLVTYEYQNLSTETITDYAFGSLLDTKLGEDDDVNIYYIGKKRGLYIENEGYRLDFRFDMPNGAANWQGTDYAGGGAFANNFISVDDTGQEQLGEDQAAEGMVAEVQGDSAIIFKTKPVTLKTGESTKLAYGVSVSAMDLAPKITSKNENGTYFGGNVTVEGTWQDIDSNSADLYAKINGKTPIKLNKDKLMNDPKNTVHDWAFEIPEAELSQTEDNQITIYLFDSDNNRSNEEVFTLKDNRKPILTLVETTGTIDGVSDFEGTLKWSDEDTDELAIYYSIDGGAKQLLSKVMNTDKGVEQTLAYKIPSLVLAGTKPMYKVEFWIEDNNKTSDSKELTLIKNNQPSIQADFSVEKTEIFETESNSYQATIINNAQEPSEWTDVVYETDAFPKNVIVDKTTVKVNGALVPEAQISFETDRKLKVALGKITPKTVTKITYDVHSLVAEPPITEAIIVNQTYKVSGKTHSETVVEKTSMVQTFTIKPQEPKINVLYLEDGNEAHELATEPIKEGKMGETIALSPKIIDGYRVSRITVDGMEQLPLPETITVEFGKDKEVIFYYEGKLEFKSAPTLLDFGTQTGNVHGMTVDSPEVVGSPLVISDTRATKQRWSLKAKITEPLTSLENDQVILTDVIKYKNSTEDILLTDADSVIFSHENKVSGAYDITANHWNKGEGFLMEFPPGSIKALGKYHAVMTITLENAK
ncbi:MucBP domain-containing protein [Candidatus Enterococcus mansonii]|uniref:MucBP domain-containing protein n=1 Tax=Candidatus Enterococcus mansonii TaxID=1834181 RepID=A0A242CI74_9ENTE|nr:MucBP domain-containing protein [Enterococcus sp. 4G2_DIV0659]OTO09937.1 hypothetical protein A5880_000620 [Enterococcus sp. 4G2_DIV0659]